MCAILASGQVALAAGPETDGGEGDRVGAAMRLIEDKAGAWRKWLGDKLLTEPRPRIPKVTIDIPPRPEKPAPNEPAPAVSPPQTPPALEAPSAAPEAIPAAPPRWLPSPGKPRPEPVPLPPPPVAMLTAAPPAEAPAPEPEALPAALPSPAPAPEPEAIPAAPPSPAPAPEPEAIPAAPPAEAPAPVRASPWKEVFRIGRAAPEGQTARDDCIARRGGFVLYCVEPVAWPEGIAGHFRIDSIMYRGAQAIVRYDGGKAVHVHALFDQGAIEAVAAFLEDMYGPPSEIFERFATPFDQETRDNPTYLWHTAGVDGGPLTTIEARRFDSTQGGFPDMRHGVVRLYQENSPPIFDLIRPRDLMLINFKVR